MLTFCAINHALLFGSFWSDLASAFYGTFMTTLQTFVSPEEFVHKLIERCVGRRRV